MKRILLAALSIMCFTGFTYAIPLELNIPSDNMKLTLEGKVVVDNTSSVVVTFTDTNESVTLSSGSYTAIRRVLDVIYKVDDSSIPTSNTAVHVIIPAATVSDINSILQ